jgi:hypothetical protein
LRGLRANGCPDETPPQESEYLGDEGSKVGLFEGEGEDPPGADGLDTSGFGYGTTCPTIPTVDVYGTTINLDPNGIFCDFFQLGGTIALIVYSVGCLLIIGTGVRS